MEYIDFNLMRETYWADTCELFKDYSHLNTAGATRFSELFSKYVNGEISYEDLFYDSITEKYAALEPAFYGIVYEEPFEDKTHINCRFIMNHPGDLLTRIILIPESEEMPQSQPIKDWDDETNVQIPADFTGKCCIEVANKDDTQNILQYTIEF